MNFSQFFGRFFSTFTCFGLNKSKPEHILDAWKKIGWNTLGILLLDVVVFGSVWFVIYFYRFHSRDLVLYVLWVGTALYFNSRYLFRFFVSWRGLFGDFNWGFVFCDRCRRLLPARKEEEKKIEGDHRLLCVTCYPPALKQHEETVEQERKRQEAILDEERKRHELAIKAARITEEAKATISEFAETLTDLAVRGSRVPVSAPASGLSERQKAESSIPAYLEVQDPTPPPVVSPDPPRSVTMPIGRFNRRNESRLARKFADK